MLLLLRSLPPLRAPWQHLAKSAVVRIKSSAVRLRRVIPIDSDNDPHIVRIVSVINEGLRSI